MPAMRPCGPSRTRSSANTPLSDTPIGPWGDGSSPPRRHRSTTAAASSSSNPSSGSRRVMSGRPAPAICSSGSSKRASERATRRAVVSLTPAARKLSTWAPMAGSSITAMPSAPSSTTTVVHSAGRRSCVDAITMPATGPAWPRSSERTGDWRPRVSSSSSTTTTRGARGASPDAPRPLAADREPPPPAPPPPNDRSTRRPLVERSAAARSTSERAVAAAASASRTIRGPPPSVACRWGNHLAQSHAGLCASLVSTSIGVSAGPWWVASCTSNERATASAASRSPTMPTTPSSASANPTGASVMVR